MGRPNGTKSATTLDIRLRTRQADYLTRISQRDEISIGQAIRVIIERAATISGAQFSPAKKERKHICVSTEHVLILDRLTARWGLTRSDVARRLIDEALAADQEG